MLKSALNKLREKERVTPFMIFNYLLRCILPRTKWGDRIYMYLKYIEVHGRRPGHDEHFNDMLYRIKADGGLDCPERVFTSDKDFVKIFVAGILGEGRTIPTLAVLTSAQEVRDYDFPEGCVIKPTHGSGDVVLVTPESGPPDKDALIGFLGRNRYIPTRERNYKPLAPKLIVEPLLFGGRPVHDYKVLCNNGEARCILYLNDRRRNHYGMWFDCAWNRLPIRNFPPGEHPVPERPECLEDLVEAAGRLARPFGLVRIDFYVDGRDFYVGEITHCHMSASETDIDPGEDRLLARILRGHTLHDSGSAGRCFSDRFRAINARGLSDA